VSLTVVIAVRGGQQPRLIYRVHDKNRRPGDKRKGFTETDYARLLAAAYQQFGGPPVLVWNYVRRNIIPVLCPAGLCGRGGWRPVSPVAGGWGAVMAGHIIITARQAS
jgi:hypothetical protein